CRTASIPLKREMASPPVAARKDKRDQASGVGDIHPRSGLRNSFLLSTSSAPLWSVAVKLPHSIAACQQRDRETFINRIV
uniref:hypothetical protein n=1 Tax=Chloroflexus sp. TaxID=1904827 RepID=UPI002ACEAC9A